jgi:hypothetical protein
MSSPIKIAVTGAAGAAGGRKLDAAFAENCGADARQSRHWPADETHARAAVGK